MKVGEMPVFASMLAGPGRIEGENGAKLKTTKPRKLHESAKGRNQEEEVSWRP
jgi:hypothetical protein